jgi:CMP-N-acetylneuraminic acid synthetase
MVMDMNIVAIIPARSGSKGLPDKNIATVCGLTLLELAVKVGVDCKVITDVVISTDSFRYEHIAVAAGAKSFGMRPKKLADDNAKTVDVVLDLLNMHLSEAELVVLLQPTSPIRTPLDIQSAIVALVNNNADAVVSVARLSEPHPNKLKIINDKGFLKEFIENSSSEIPRQCLPSIYKLNGAIYVIKKDVLIREKTFFPQKTIPYIMEHSINIDDEYDLILLREIVRLKKVELYGANA